jgi:hypothetical protein
MSGLGTLSTLPPELRIQIYNYVLLDKNEEIKVDLTMRRKPSHQAERQRILRLKRLAAEGRAFKPVAVENSLLYVSKRISNEACAVLYGGHKFKLRTPRTLEWFLIHIGENRQHIRHVCVTNEFEMRDVPAVGRIAEKLVGARNLRSLTLRPVVEKYVETYGRTRTIHFFDNVDIDLSQTNVDAIITRLALVSEKLLKSLYRAQKSEDKIAGVVDIFRLDRSPYKSAQEQLSAFWKSAVEVRIGEST